MRKGGLLPLLVLVTACAGQQVTLLPGEEGHPTGALAVLDQNGGDEAVLNKPLASAKLNRGRASLRTLSTVKAADQRVIATLPPPAHSFTIYFFEGTTKMTPESQPILDAIRKEIALRPGAEVQVTGHTDTLGSDDDNDRLSNDRANEILKVLIAAGLPPDVLSAVGRGERDLLVPTADGVANAANRRVEVIVR